MKKVASLFVLCTANAFAPHAPRRTNFALKVRSQKEFHDFEDPTTFFDASDFSDPAVEVAAMKCAVNIADKLLKKKKTELQNETTEHVQKQYVMLKKASTDLAEVYSQYQKDVSTIFHLSSSNHYHRYNTHFLHFQPTSFRKDFASKGKEQSALALEMLEAVIADTAEEMLDLEREEQYFIHAFHEALEREEIAEAKAAQARALENSASKDLSLIDDFDDYYEIDERKRELNRFHVGEIEEQTENRLKTEAMIDEREYLIQEFDVKKKIESLKEKEEHLKTDLDTIKDIIRDQLRAEWNDTKSSESQKYLDSL